MKLLKLILFLIPVAAEAVSFTYEGQLIKPDSNPVNGVTTQIRIQVRTPDAASCLLYEETQTKNLSATSGYFNFRINDGSGTRLDSSGYSFDQIFSNQSSFLVPSANCVSGSGTVTYTPAAQDGRSIKVVFKDENMGTWEEFPLEPIGHIPYSMQAANIGGYPATSLLRVENAGSPAPVSVLSTANYSDLIALIAGTSTKYMTKSSNGASVPSFATDPSSPTAGSIWYDSTLNQLKFYNGTTPQALSAGGAGISSLNGLTAPTQTFTTPGVSGVAPNWVSASGTHTLHIPMANMSAVAGGLISKGDYDNFSAKLSSTLNNGMIWVGNGSNVATPVAMSGDATMSSSGAVTLNTAVAMLNGRAGGQILAGGTAPADNLTLDSTTNGTKGNIVVAPAGGNVGIGASIPNTKLDVNGAITVRPSGTGGGQAGEIMLRELAANGTNVIRLRAPDALSADVSLLMPSSVGGNGQVLTTDGAGVLSWTTLSSSASSVQAVPGTAVAPSISFSSDTDTGFYLPTLGEIGVSAGGTQVFNFSASGMNAIATRGAVVGGQTGAAAVPTYSFSGDTNTGIYSPAADMLSFSTAGTERIRISSTGEIGIGTSSIMGKLDIVESSMPNNVLINTYSNTSSDYSMLSLRRGRGTAASPANAQFNDPIGSITASPYASGMNITGKIGFTLTDPTAGPGSLGTSMSFYTTPQGSSLLTQRMVIRDGGNVGIGTNAPIYTLDVYGDINANNCVKTGGSTTIGGTCTSDERLKTEIQNFDLGLEALLGVQPHFFKYNGLGGVPASKNFELGVIAQEVEKTAPELIVKKSVKLHPDDQETTEIKQVNYSAFTYILINAVKDLHQENQDLRKRLERLEKIVSAQSR